MKRSLLVVATVVLLLCIAVATYFGSSDAEYEQAVSSLAAFESLNINCPNIHDVVGTTNATGPRSVAGGFPDAESSGRIVGQTPDGQDIFAASDGTVGITVRSASPSVAGKTSPSGEPIAATIIGLSFKYSKLNDDLLADVVNVNSLQAIGIENSNVTATGLELLTKLPNLTVFYVGPGNVNLSQETLRDFGLQHPQVRLVRDENEYTRQVSQLK